MEMYANLSRVFLFCLLLLSPFPSSSLPLCTDLRAPIIPKNPLTFCPYNGRVCCKSTKDSQLQKQFRAMNISVAACASAVRSILCATCDPFSAELFKGRSGPGSVPRLCNDTVSATSSLSSQTTNSFCSSVWDACRDVPMVDSPFAPSLQTSAGVQENSTSSKLTDLWQSKSEFCQAFGGSSDENSFCFSGSPISLNKTEPLPPPPKGLCLEKISNGSYINMVAHPDGSNRAFFSDQAGRIWLASVPEQDSGESLGLDESSPFVDLTDQVYLDTSFGMMGMAFHPNFAQNGRFFASFNCDKAKSPDCAGRCACNSDVNCDPSKIGSSNAALPCQYQTVIAEYSANGTASHASLAEKANPREVRRIFTMGLPFTSNHGGQILFGPEDGYLYHMMGDGGNKGDPFNFAQNKNSLLGKIMRFDIDNIPSAEEIAQLGRWGNYSIPPDNPYTEDKELEPEIWALGLRSPWRCSFDAERPSYFLCADVGQDQYEEVDVITKGGNYGWSVYEGPLLFKPEQTTQRNTSVDLTDDLTFPVMGYSHSEVNKEGSAAISGGFFYRSTTDPCLYGSYLYGDLYATDIWTAAENPKNSGNFTTKSVPFRCSDDSPIQCVSVPDSPLPALGYIFSFAQDNRRDVFILASGGVYRVVRPSRCKFTCAKENVTAIANPTTHPASNGYITEPTMLLSLCLSSLLLVLISVL